MDSAQKDNSEKILTIGGKEATPKTEKDRENQLLAEKQEIETLFKNGEIDSVEYNCRMVDLEVTNEYKIKRLTPIKTKRRALIILAILLIIIAIPAAIYLNFRFFFKNTLKAEGIEIDSAELVDESGEPKQIEDSSLENGPVQTMVVFATESGEYKGRNIDVTFTAYYDITGVVTSVYDYWGFDDYATLVPRDVCLAWGNLAEAFKSGGAKFTQLYRQCYGKSASSADEPAETFDYKTPFGQTRSSLAQMSNNHLIASTVEIRDQILGLRVGDEVRMTGYLVNVSYGEDLYLRSSTRRNDVGDGACEVFYVTGVENRD